AQTCVAAQHINNVERVAQCREQEPTAAENRVDWLDSEPDVALPGMRNELTYALDDPRSRRCDVFVALRHATAAHAHDVRPQLHRLVEIAKSVSNRPWPAAVVHPRGPVPDRGIIRDGYAAPSQKLQRPCEPELLDPINVQANAGDT